MTREEFIAIRPKVLQALGDSPRKPSELIEQLLEEDEGLEDTQVRNTVRWMIGEGMVRFRKLRLEAIPQNTEDVLATN